MRIQEELNAFLRTTLPESETKGRNIEIVNKYYGFYDSEWYTYQAIGDNYNFSRQAIHQIIDSNFRNIIDIDALPSLRMAADALNRKEATTASEFLSEIAAYNLIDLKDNNLHGLLKLLTEFGLCTDYRIYAPTLEKLTQRTEKLFNEKYLISNETFGSIKGFWSKVRTFPGMRGIANFQELAEHYGISNDHRLLLKSMIINSPDSWVFDGNDFWYTFQDRDNVLINYSEKVFSLSYSYDIGVLAATYRNALNARSLNFSYPSIDILETYFRQSSKFSTNGRSTSFLGGSRGLTDIEIQTVGYLQENGTVMFAQLREHLVKAGFDNPHIIKSITTSPLVSVDESRGRRNYRYSLISGVENVNDETDDYMYYKNRLREKLEAGTDADVETIARREQHILQEWLFRSKDHEHCAICGRRLPISSLVAAHKKPRRNCTEDERTDPNVVMPICLFGCDFLYEREFICVDGNQVRIDRTRGGQLADGFSYVETLEGRRISEQWLNGGESFFSKPDWIRVV